MVEIISVHIGKTAGTAFRHILATIYGQDKVFEAYNPSDKRLTLSDPETLENIKVIHGHFKASIYQQSFPEAKWMVWLRHPVFRLISHYFYQKSRKKRSEEIKQNPALEQDLDLLEFAEVPENQNLQSLYIDDMDLKDFYFVGIQEFFTEDLADLQQLMGWSEFKINSRNEDHHPQYISYLVKTLGNTRLLNKLISLNKKDMKLYQSALSLRAKRRQESKWLQSTLADWKHSQFLIKKASQKLQKTEKKLEQSRYWLQKSENKVEVIDVIQYSQDEVSESILGFGIYWPEAKTKIISNSIKIRGWVLGKKARAVEVKITCEDHILAQIPVNQIRPKIAQLYPDRPEAENSGFETTLEITGMSTQSSLLIQVILEDQSKTSIAKIQALELEINLRRYLSLAENLRQEGYWDESIQFYQKLIELQPQQDPKIYRDLSETLKQAGRFDEIASIYEKAISLNPKMVNIRIYLEIAESYVKSGKIADAISYNQKAVNLKLNRYKPAFLDDKSRSTQLNSPHFLLIGVLKCGTTSLYDYICQHPQVLPAVVKEPQILQQGKRRMAKNEMLDYYLSFFPPCSGEDYWITGEATPDYFRFPDVAETVKHYFPKIKLIMILRNPIKRAISHYNMAVRVGKEKRSINEAVHSQIEAFNSVEKAEQYLLDKKHFNLQDYIKPGLYVYYLQYWLQLFPRNQLLILTLEDLSENPSKVMEEVFKFLGLPHHNGSEYSPRNQKLPFTQGDEALLSYLSEFYQPHNKKLEDFLGRTLSWS